jgi:hypothetical protein
MTDTIIGDEIRLKFWEIAPYFRCPVVGTCLSISEQATLLKKAGISAADQSPFEIHETLVSAAGNENRLSRRIDGFLCRKFARETAALCKCSPESLVEQFRASLESGEIAGVLWIAAFRSDLLAEQRRQMFSMLHMTMHADAGQRKKLERKLAEQAKAADGMKQDLKRAIADRRSLQKGLERCQMEKVSLQNALTAANNEKTRLREILQHKEDGTAAAMAEKEMKESHNEADAFHRQLEESRQYATALEEDNAQLLSELSRWKEANRQFHDEAQEVFHAIARLLECNAGCAASGLCRKRILIVGGIERMETLYRNLIEVGGGIFEYHDGYVNNGARDLENRVMRADMVLCPINCISHAACSIVKRLGKKHSKTVHMLHNFSLSSVAKAIWNEGGGISGTPN